MSEQRDLLVDLVVGEPVSVRGGGARGIRAGLVTVVLLGGGFAVGCTGAGVTTCVPGRSLECTCADLSTGVQVCQTDGTYGACQCPGGPGPDMSGGHDMGPTDAPVDDGPVVEPVDGTVLDQPVDSAADRPIDAPADAPDVQDVGSDSDAGPLSCTTASNCPLGHACDPTSHVCTTACSSSSACNVGCCSAAQGGTCQPGTADDACGGRGDVGDGSICMSCAGDFNGPRCQAQIQGPVVFYYCGCTSPDQCQPLEACGTHSLDIGVGARYVCTNDCLNGVCNGGCCEKDPPADQPYCVAQCPNGAQCGSGGNGPNYCP